MGTRNILKTISKNLDDSMGLRTDNLDSLSGSQAVLQLSPIPNPKDIGRKGLRNFGRLSIANVIPDPDQPRAEFDEEAIKQFAMSIKDQGQLQPIRVRWSDEHQTWIIISGERRYRAVKRAGIETIDCFFQENKLSKTEILEQQMIENLLRCNLRPVEEAKAFEQLILLNGWSGRELAEALRINSTKVSRSLALLKLPADILQLVESGDLSPTVAYEVSKLPNAAQQRSVLLKENNERTTVNNIGLKTAKKTRTQPKRQRGIKQTFLSEEGWKVVISSPRKGNYHEMEVALLHALEEVRHRIDNNVVLS